MWDKYSLFTNGPYTVGENVDADKEISQERLARRQALGKKASTRLDQSLSGGSSSSQRRRRAAAEPSTIKGSATTAVTSPARRPPVAVVRPAPPPRVPPLSLIHISEPTRPY